MRLTAIYGVAAMMLLTSYANAAFDLRVTEIYFGQDDPDVTEDWFELTNLGDSAWIEANHGILYYDDSSPDPAKADPLMGIDYILPGQSVIFVGDADNSGFLDAWSNVPGVRVGTHDGSGLGTGGDEVNLWLGDPMLSSPFESASYPDAGALIGMGMIDDGATYDVFLGEFSTVGNAAGAVASAALGGGDGILPATVPAVGSPGSIPEPSAALLVISVIASVGAARSRR